MTEHVESADGTRLACDRTGSGPPLLLIAGLFCDRRTLRPLADAIASEFDVVTYDRRGRGDSGDTKPYAVAREVDDVAAVLAALGGSAAVYGHSSGAGLALEAVAAGLPIGRVVLHEPPYDAVDDDASRQRSRQLAEVVSTAIAEGRPGDAIGAFFTSSGMPDEVAASMATDPAMLAVAPSMPYDLAVMGDGAIPVERVRRVTVPTLVIAGSESEDFFRATATRLVDLLPDARLTILDGADHGAPADLVAPAIAPFLLGT